MPEDNDTDITLAGAGVDAAPAGDAAVSDKAASPEAITLDEITAQLGKKFESKEAALKAFKDTFSYVGKKQDDAAREAERKLEGSGEYVRRSEIETEFFYRDNPEAAAHRTLVDAVAKANGISAREAATLPDVKKVISAASAYEAQEAAKTVMASTGRLGTTGDKLAEARKAMASGNKAAAGEAATAAVREAFGF